MFCVDDIDADVDDTDVDGGNEQFSPAAHLHLHRFYECANHKFCCWCKSSERWQNTVIPTTSIRDENVCKKHALNKTSFLLRYICNKYYVCLCP